MSDVTEPLVDQTMVDTVIQATTMAVIIVLSVFCNALILVGFYQHKPLQTFTNAFVVNLACTDLCFGLLAMPLTLVTSITVDWVFGDSMCKYHGFMLVLCSEASIWTLTFVSFERYLAIRHPFRHQRWMTPNVVSAAITSVWIIAVVFACLPFVISEFTFYRFNHICVADWRISFQTTLVYCIFSVFIPLILMTVSNIGILKTALEQNRKVDVKVGNIRKLTVEAQAAGAAGGAPHNAERSAGELEAIVKAKTRRKKETRATILILVIVGSFAICWLPYTITTMCLMIEGYDCLWPSRFFVASAWLTNLNSALNPILYAVFNVTFRRAIKQVLGIRRARTGPQIRQLLLLPHAEVQIVHEHWQM